MKIRFTASRCIQYRSTRELTLSIHSTGNSHRGFRRASGWHFLRAAAHITRGHARSGHDVPPCHAHLNCSAWQLRDGDVPLESDVLRQRYDA